ncbi:hypothetical protein VTL71DRAFT_7049 [Oculimacula yallundae]|uniref:DUF6697 domain-containing protein n=1 Tax=Oculimacula yallundae TaxID=86028 RepID=A0ABR4BVK1_9HELO
MSSNLERAKARLLSANQTQEPLHKNQIHTNGIQNRKSTVDLTQSPAIRKRVNSDSSRRSLVEMASVSSVRREASGAPIVNTTQTVIDQLQAQLIKLVEDQREDHLEARQHAPVYPRPPSSLSTESRSISPEVDSEDDIKSEDDAPNIYDDSPGAQEVPERPERPQLPELLQKSRSVSRQSNVALQQRAAFEADSNLLPPEECTIALYDGMQMPHIIRELAPCEPFHLPANPSERFSFDFLKAIFGGSSTVNGCYTIPTRHREHRLFPEINSYRVLKAEHEPLLPRYPEQYGAQLSCLFSDEDGLEQDFPLFICDGGAGTGYRYYGTYGEPRASDLLRGSEMCSVSHHVKHFWAKLLGTQTSSGKSRSALDTFMHAWPRVPVGWVDEDSGVFIAFDATREDEFGEPMTRTITVEEAIYITEDDVMDALNMADYNLRASINLFYGYLQCTGYDARLYAKLVAEYSKFQKQR